MVTWPIIVRLALLLSWPMLGSGSWAQEEVELTQPNLTPMDMSGPAVITPPLSASASRPDPATVCAALGAALAVQGDDAATGAACSFTTGRFFALVRAGEDGIETMRLKLNSEASRETADLGALADLLLSVSKRLGWSVPPLVLAAVRQPQSQRCQWGLLRFDFSRERGDVPRFNLILAFGGETALDPERFGPWLPVC